jgi:hypothetical protein
MMDETFYVEALRGLALAAFATRYIVKGDGMRQLLDRTITATFVALFVVFFWYAGREH